MRLTKWAVLIMLVLSTTAMAAEMNEAKFRSWTGGLTLDGLKFYDIEQDGQKLTASFVNPAKPHQGARFISMAPLAEFQDYQKMLDNPKMRMGPTQGLAFKGMRGVIVDTQSEIGMMVAIEARNINKTIVVSFPSKTAQTAIESSLGRIGLAEK